MMKMHLLTCWILVTLGFDLLLVLHLTCDICFGEVDSFFLINYKYGYLFNIFVEDVIMMNDIF